MKKISSLLLVCVFLFGIVTIFSGVASALTIVGDPYVGDSWHQPLREYRIGGFDTMEMSMESERGEFKRPSYFSDSSWSTTSYSSKHLMCRGNNIIDLIFEVVFEGEIPEYLRFSFIARRGSIIMEKVTACWMASHWDLTDNTNNVPDAGIMWLLGPAFIALGLLGRKKSQVK